MMRILTRICLLVGVLLAIMAAAPFVSSLVGSIGSSQSASFEVDDNASSYSDGGIVVEDCEAVSVERVVDGDTILIEGDVYVRLIGIDAPESVHPDESRNSEDGVASSDFLKSILNEGDTVYLEYDEETYDQYGRTLAYVWTSDMSGQTVDVESVRSYMLQGVILDAGMAEAKVYQPNDKYAEVFELIAS